MANYELVFDFGSAFISAGLKTDGFTDKIPSVVAVGADGQLMAVGVDALRLHNTVGSGVKLTRPILEGAIIDNEGAKALISALLNRLVNYKMSAFSRYNVTVAVPCGLISSDKNTIESVFLALGAKQVGFIETPLADSAQLFGEFRTRQGVVVNIGYDCTDLAVVYANAIVAGCTVYYSGKNLTEAIMERIRTKYMIQLSFDAAEFLKLNCASLYPNDSSAVAVTGVNTQTGATEQVSISSKELYDTLVDFVRKYVKIIQSLIASVPDEVATLVRADGVMLCGGGARLAGLDMFLQSELGMPIYVSSYPEDVTIKGLLA
ncbi:MAG: rod shape-determining protein [Clostridiales bacterium]|nr:rod shape-determining protein [Clostridiales bacterium]